MLYFTEGEIVLSGRGRESRESSPALRDLFAVPSVVLLLCTGRVSGLSSRAGPPLNHLSNVATRKFKTTRVCAWFSVGRCWSTICPFNPKATFKSWIYSHPQFIDGETEAQRGEVTVRGLVADKKQSQDLNLDRAFQTGLLT